jgi:hypothetical protein
MTLNLVIVGVVLVFMVVLDLLGMVTEIGFLLVGSIVLGMVTDAYMVGNVSTLSWGSVVLSVTDGTLLLLLVAVVVVISSGLLIELRLGRSWG